MVVDLNYDELKALVGEKTSRVGPNKTLFGVPLYIISPCPAKQVQKVDSGGETVELHVSCMPTTTTRKLW